MTTLTEPAGSRPHEITPARIAVYALLIATSLLFLAPIYNA